MPAFDPQDDIPDLSGKMCLVTGGNSGLGEATLGALARHNPANLYLAARSHAKAEAAVLWIRATSEAAASGKIEILELNLASFKSVKAAAARVNDEVDRLDLLQLCGGVDMTPNSAMKDGHKLQFGTNYLGILPAF